MPTNDNEFTMNGGSPHRTDPHGQAALLLVESLIHGLCENDTLSVGQAVAIAERAAEVQLDCAQAADGPGAPLWRSHALLSQIASSLRADGGGDLPPQQLPS
jgi:hypothetical protein